MELTIVRAPPKPNLFTPTNDFAHGKFYSVNVPEMAAYTGTQSLLIEETFGRTLVEANCWLQRVELWKRREWQRRECQSDDIQGSLYGMLTSNTLWHGKSLVNEVDTRYSLAIVTTGMCYFLFRRPRATYAERVLNARAFGADAPRGMKGWA